MTAKTTQGYKKLSFHSWAVAVEAGEVGRGKDAETLKHGEDRRNRPVEDGSIWRRVCEIISDDLLSIKFAHPTSPACSVDPFKKI